MTDNDIAISTETILADDGVTVRVTAYRAGVTGVAIQYELTATEAETVVTDYGMRDEAIEALIRNEGI